MADVWGTDTQNTNLKQETVAGFTVDTLLNTFRIRYQQVISTNKSIY